MTKLTQYIYVSCKPDHTGKGAKNLLRELRQKVKKPGYDKNEPVAVWKPAKTPEVL